MTQRAGSLWHTGSDWRAVHLLQGNGFAKAALQAAVADYRVLAAETDSNGSVPLAAFGVAAAGLQERLDCTLPMATKLLLEELRRLGVYVEQFIGPAKPRQ